MKPTLTVEHAYRWFRAETTYPDHVCWSLASAEVELRKTCAGIAPIPETDQLPVSNPYRIFFQGLAVQS